MLFESAWWIWPFAGAFIGAWIIVGILLLAFWIWMIVDAAKRKFFTTAEKVLWIVIIVLGGWIGALIYFIVVRMYNHKGIFKK